MSDVGHRKPNRLSTGSQRRRTSSQSRRHGPITARTFTTLAFNILHCLQWYKLVLRVLAYPLQQCSILYTLYVHKSSLEAAKRSCYRTANSIFGKIGRYASEETTLQLIQSKCIPALLYGLEACPRNKSDLRSLDFVLDRFFMKQTVQN